MSTVHYLTQARAGKTPEVMIALHCSASNGRQWDAYEPLLPPGMRLVAPELMGYAKDERWTSGTPVHLEEEARRLAPLLSTADGVHLVGHSYGGAVALQMALRWPERVKTLTLFEPVRFALLLADRQHEEIGRAILGIGRRIGSHALSGRLDEAAALFVDYWSGPGTWEATPQSRRRAIAERMHKVRAEFEALFADRVPASSYRGLTMPVRLITGTRSPLPARAVTNLIAGQCAQAQVIALDGIGHMGAVAHPAKVAPHLAFMPTDAESFALAA